MIITALKPAALQASPSSQLSEPLNLRIQKTHPEAFGAHYTQAVKVVLSKPTEAYSPEGLLDEMLVTLVLESNAQPVRQKIEAYVTDEFPAWTMRDWWTTADIFDDAEPF